MIKRVLHVGAIVFFLASVLILFLVRTRIDSSNRKDIGSKSHSAEIKNNEDFVLSTSGIKNDSETSKVLDPEVRPFWSLAELLEQNSPGQRRLNFIRQYFFDSNESIEDLLEEGKNLLSDKEFLHAMTGLECRIALCDKIELNRIFNSIEQQELTKDHGSVLMYGLSYRLSPLLAAATMRVDAPSGFGQELPKTEFDDLAFHFGNLFKVISEKDKHKATEVFFQGASSGNSRASIEFLFNNRDFLAYTSVEVQKILAIDLVRDNPEDGLELLLNKCSDQNQNDVNLLARAFEELFRVDEQLGEKYLSRIASIANGKILDSYQHGKTNVHIENGNFSEATLAAAEIFDEKLKREIDWKIWKKQSDEVKNNVSKEPKVIIEAFISGESPFEQKYLETAVSEWIKMDPDQAAEWAEAHINEMADGPRQYVAASYANEAATQGDIATARQWANLIQDEKTLTRINGIIERAEQAVSD